MEVIKMKDVELKTNARGVGMRTLVDRDTVRVTNLVLNPGDRIPEHSVPVDVFFYVVEGEGTIKIGDETAQVEATDIVICPANTEMAVEATNGRFVVLNVKTPNLSSVKK